MKRPIYDIKTYGDVTVIMQVTTPYIETEYGTELLPDEICIVAEDYDYDKDESIETVILLNKKQAIDFAIKLLELANEI